MTQPARIQKAVWLIVFVPLWVSLACNTLTGGSRPAADSPPGEITIEQDLTFGPGAFIYTDPGAGLTDLTSYQATLTVSFDGIRKGTTDQWSKTYTMLAANDPHARQWTIEHTGGTSDPGPVFLAELDGIDYERRGQEACSGTEIPQSDSLSDRLELASFLTGVIGADEAGVDTVNEIATTHYTFDERAIGEEGLTESTGELWVGVDEGYLVKYLLTRKAGPEYFGEGIEGILTLHYELIDVNQPVTIALPEDCPPGMVDAPLLPDASNITRLPGLLSYETSTSVSEVAAFYQEQIPTLGWIPEGAPDIKETNAFIAFRQAEQRLMVVIKVEGEVIQVMVSVNRVAP